MKILMLDWWKWHEGWLAAGFVAVSSFGLGYACASAEAAVSHRETVREMASAYQSALSSKDQVIAKLANTAADTASAAVTAADTASLAADTAAQAADTASKVATGRAEARAPKKAKPKPETTSKMKGWER